MTNTVLAYSSWTNQFSGYRNCTKYNLAKLTVVALPLMLKAECCRWCTYRTRKDRFCTKSLILALALQNCRLLKIGIEFTDLPLKTWCQVSLVTVYQSTIITQAFLAYRAVMCFRSTCVFDPQIWFPFTVRPCEILRDQCPWRDDFTHRYLRLSRCWE